jgi:hypothetical protein
VPAAEEGLDLVYEFPWVDRYRIKGIESGSFGALWSSRAGRAYSDQRHIPECIRGPHEPGGSVAVHAGHGDVHDDEIGRIGQRDA